MSQNSSAAISFPLSPGAESAPAQKNALPLNGEQLTILRWIADGKRNHEIAELMNINCDKVQRLTKQVMDILGTPSRAGAVARALRKGMIE